MGALKTAGTITRRTFLIGSAALAGGVAFGTYMARRPIPNPLLNDLKDGEAAITPFIKVNADGITLITPRADKGQGSYSCLLYTSPSPRDQRGSRMPSSA